MPIFPTGYSNKATPVGADKILIADSEASNQTKEVDIEDLPISTATQSAIANKVDKTTTVNGQALSSNVLLDADDIDDSSTTHKFTTASDISKLSGIETGAEVNNISDVNANDLTDGGDTSLHAHDSRYYTKSETPEVIEDTIGTKVKAGSNVAVTYNDLTGETTIDASLSGTGLTSTSVSSVDGDIAVMDGATGQVLRTSGISLDSKVITPTTLASSGGLLINIDNAIGDIARTTDGFLENNEALGIFIENSISAISAEADTAVQRTGSKTLKLSTTDATGRLGATLNLGQWTGASVTVPNIYKNAVPIKPSTKYKITCWVKTNNAATNSVYIAFDQFNTSGTRLVNTASSTLSGTNDWKLLAINVTTNASASFGTVAFLNFVVGNISDAWFDVNSMTLEEVVEPVANSLTSSSPSIQSFTSVGSTDNIDQSQLTANDARFFGMSGSSSSAPSKLSQQFTATKSKFTGVTLKRLSSIGTFTGNVTINIEGDTSNAPNGTVYASYTYTNVAWEAITADTDFTVNLPYNLTTDGTTKYHIVFSSSTLDDSNYPRVRATSGGGTAYTGGVCVVLSGASTWTTVGYDLYFKTLYYKPTTNFKASQNNSTVSISADEEGFINGSIIDIENGNATFVESFGTFYIHNYTVSGSDLIAKVKLPGDSISGIVTSDKVITYSTDNVTYVSAFPIGATLIYIKIASYSGITSFSYNIKFDTSTIHTLYNHPTNKNLVNVYTKSLSSATTTAIYRATKFGFPAIEYTNGEYQFLDIDTTATGSTVAFSSNGSSYTTVADGASIALTSTTTPVVYVRSNITANRIYLSSNDYNASSNKDGSNNMVVVYNVIKQGIMQTIEDLINEIERLKQKISGL